MALSLGRTNITQRLYFSSILSAPEEDLSIVMVAAKMRSGCGSGSLGCQTHNHYVC